MNNDLNEVLDTHVDALWLDKAVCRANELDNGSVQLVASDEVSRKAWALLR